MLKPQSSSRIDAKTANKHRIKGALQAPGRVKYNGFHKPKIKPIDLKGILEIIREKYKG